MPDGTPADAETAAAVAATVRQMHACRNAGNVARYLALFSGAAIRGSPVHTALAAAVLTGEVPPPEPGTVGQPRHFPGLFHPRVLPDGRVAAVGPAGVVGVPELYVFVRTEADWLIDDIAPVVGPDGVLAAFAGVVDNTYTGERRISDVDRQAVGGYGYGLAWGPEWTPIIASETSDVSSPDRRGAAKDGHASGHPGRGDASPREQPDGDPRRASPHGRPGWRLLR